MTVYRGTQPSFMNHIFNSVYFYSLSNQEKEAVEGFVFQMFMMFYLLFRWLIEWIKPISKPYLEMSAIQWACLLGIYYYSILFFQKKKRLKNGGLRHG